MSWVKIAAVACGVVAYTILGVFVIVDYFYIVLVVALAVALGIWISTLFEKEES